MNVALKDQNQNSTALKKAKICNQDPLETFVELIRDAHQHMTSLTTKNSVNMTSKGRHCDWGIV
jgi:peptidoglycan hydrolase CwlO-like protein